MAAADFESTVRIRGPALLRVAVLLTGDDQQGQDLLQDVLVRVWPRWDRIRAGSPEAYVRRSLTNAAMSHFRLARVRRRGAAELVEDASGLLDPDLERLHDRMLVLAALRELAPRMRAAVVLRHYVGLSEQETADSLGCTVGTVKSSTARALDRLRHVLGSDDSVGRTD